MPNTLHNGNVVNRATGEVVPTPTVKLKLRVYGERHDADYHGIVRTAEEIMSLPLTEQLCKPWECHLRGEKYMVRIKYRMSDWETHVSACFYSTVRDGHVRHVYLDPDGNAWMIFGEERLARRTPFNKYALWLHDKIQAHGQEWREQAIKKILDTAQEAV